MIKRNNPTETRAFAIRSFVRKTSFPLCEEVAAFIVKSVANPSARIASGNPKVRVVSSAG